MSPNLNNFFMQDLHFWSTDIEYHQGQIRHTSILESKPFVETYYIIRYRLDLKYFLFTQFVQSMQVWIWLSNIAFHLQLFWLQTLIATVSESCQRLISHFCMQPSEVAVLFYWNLSRFPFLTQVMD